MRLNHEGTYEKRDPCLLASGVQLQVESLMVVTAVKGGHEEPCIHSHHFCNDLFIYF